MSAENRIYIARLIALGRVHQTQEFEAKDDASAWRTANDGIDPLKGLWVEVTRKPRPKPNPETRDGL